MATIAKVRQVIFEETEVKRKYLQIEDRFHLKFMGQIISNFLWRYVCDLEVPLIFLKLENNEHPR